MVAGSIDGGGCGGCGGFLKLRVSIFFKIAIALRLNKILIFYFLEFRGVFAPHPPQNPEMR